MTAMKLFSQDRIVANLALGDRGNSGGVTQAEPLENI